MKETVSLLIKSSYQGEGDMLYRQVRHIVTMLEKRNFCEVFLIFDNKEDNFIRQYAESSKNSNILTAEKLRNQGYIDKWEETPSDEKTIRELYERWFGSETTETHTLNNSPMAQPLYAFEITKGKYTLQVDADVMICRRDWTHAYLRDMIESVESGCRVVSVGFNIAHKDSDAKPYTSPMSGEYVPEVRICLFQKDRLLSLRPFPNEIVDGKYRLTWYRSLQKLQHERDMVSLRGGDGRTFYIHPPNDRKKDKNQLYGIMRQVEHNQIPDIQFESVDLVGTEADWKLRPIGIGRWHNLCHVLRTSNLATALYGCEYVTNMNRIEIDITYACNLKCDNCARSCSQAPDIAAMSPKQIEKFVRESIARNIHWDKIGVLGGEPLLHPELQEILNILLSYKHDFSSSTLIEITTNGYGNEVVSQFSRIPKEISVINTRKTTPHQEYFEPFNRAPIDQWKFAFSNYQNCCSTTSDCGFGLNTYGFYPCGVAGSIDRVMGLDIGLKKLPVISEEFNPLKSALCRYCGHFCSRHHIPQELRKKITGTPMSKSWMLAYRNFEQNKPNLTKYG